MAALPPSDDPFAARYVNLADERLGAVALEASDDFFAPRQRMLNPEPAVFIPGKYDDNGKWMDGWESRRKRVSGYDWCIVKLGRPGSITGVDIDTSHFTGNYPPAASLEACNVNGNPDASTVWTEILPAQSLGPSSHHFHEIAASGTWSHVRLNIYPDGGVARLRVYGVIEPADLTGEIDLLAIENGARAIAASDEHYGKPWALLRPGRGVNMGDGWETRRRREPGNEWCILALGRRGVPSKLVIDTAHFKGNFPDRCSIQAANVTFGTDKSLITQAMFWQTLLPEQKMQMDHIHSFEKELADLGPITHIRINVIPDGGLSRVRLFGKVV
ncbi:allantoicase [Lacibacterium aquatile]|uniref:Probable allantoicase n=1 Tax=Lacibacterium aquatile TaxID=1168082 RepID=A0ABW5DTQ2_9PROT